MEPVAELASTHFNPNLCMICQKKKGSNEELSVAKGQGIQKLLEVTKERRSVFDNANATIIDRLDTILPTAAADVIFCYHRTCYADFTNKSSISRLKQRYQEKCESNTSVSEACHSRREHFRRATPSDWKMCIVYFVNQTKKST